MAQAAHAANVIETTWGCSSCWCSFRILFARNRNHVLFLPKWLWWIVSGVQFFQTTPGPRIRWKSIVYLSNERVKFGAFTWTPEFWNINEMLGKKCFFLRIKESNSHRDWVLMLKKALLCSLPLFLSLWIGPTKASSFMHHQCELRAQTSGIVKDCLLPEKRND